MNSPTEEIKARLDIVEFIRSYVRLEKAGINFKAPCPFHTEKTPSFFVSPTRQTWHCFGGCGEGGDIFKFVMKIEGLDFPEALRLLGARAGVVIARENPALRSERNRLYDVCEAAASVFERQLLLTTEPKEYLKSRGMSEETVRRFRIGWAPASWDFILRALAKKRFTPEDAEHAGLAIRSDKNDGSRYDRFRSRIIFPITDANARVIGFGGRAADFAVPLPKLRSVEAKFPMGQDGTGTMLLNDGQFRQRDSGTPKYINTPQTLIYDKSRALYGFDKAKQEIRAKNNVVVTEGYMDCVMSHQAGVAHTIAVSGTALTAHQLTILRRLCDTMICSFDADAAGESATRRSLALAAQYDFARLIAAIPSGKDPADTVRENPGAWRDAVAAAKPVVAFYFEKAFREENPETAEGKKKIAASLLPWIAELADEIEKAHWIGDLARKLGVSEEAIRRDLQRKGASVPPGARVGRDTAPAVASAPTSSRRALLEDRLVALLAAAADDIRALYAGEEIDFVAEMNGRLFRLLTASAHDAGADLAAGLEDARFRGEMLASQIADVPAEIMLCARYLKEIINQEKRRALETEIGRKERSGDHDSVLSDLQEFDRYAKRFNSLA